MDIDRMAKEWPKMIARIEALERRADAADAHKVPVSMLGGLGPNIHGLGPDTDRGANHDYVDPTTG